MAAATVNRAQQSQRPNIEGFFGRASGLAVGTIGGADMLRPMTQPTILTLIRHGETPANSGGIWHGSIDTPLTARGEAQAEAVAAYISGTHRDCAKIYASPLQRAHRTASAIQRATGCELEVEHEIQEYDLGSWEGRSYQALHEEEQLWHHLKTDPDFAPHGGESPRQVVARFTKVLTRFSESHRGERIVVVSHGGALSMVMGHFLDGDYSQWHKVMDNCGVSELVLEPEPQLLSFNYTAHLDGI